MTQQEAEELLNDLEATSLSAEKQREQEIRFVQAQIRTEQARLEEMRRRESQRDRSSGGGYRSSSSSMSFGGGRSCGGGAGCSW